MWGVIRRFCTIIFHQIVRTGSVIHADMLYTKVVRKDNCNFGSALQFTTFQRNIGFSLTCKIKKIGLIDSCRYLLNSPSRLLNFQFSTHLTSKYACFLSRERKLDAISSAVAFRRCYPAPALCLVVLVTFLYRFRDRLMNMVKESTALRTPRQYDPIFL